MALASCSSDDVIIDEPQNTQGTPIGFQAYTDKVTRATGTNSTELNDFYTTFNVYGWKFIGGTASVVFNNVTNEYFTADGKGSSVYTADNEKPSMEWSLDSYSLPSWFYKGIRYYDKMASSYVFSAYTPITASSDVTCTSDQKITIGTSESPVAVETTNLQATASDALKYTGFTKDYMLAQASQKTGEVNLVFSHKLAKFNIKLVKDANTTTTQNIVVNSIVIKNLMGNGYYDSSWTSTETGQVSNWKTGTTEATGYTLSDLKLNGDGNVDGKYVMEQLMIPQSAAKSSTPAQVAEQTEACIYVKYTIGSEEFAAHYALANMFIASSSTDTSYKFEGGNQYTLTITVGPEPIHFTPSVTAWEDEKAGSLNAN